MACGRQPCTASRSEGRNRRPGRGVPSKELGSGAPTRHRPAGMAHLLPIDAPSGGADLQPDGAHVRTGDSSEALQSLQVDLTVLARE